MYSVGISYVVLLLSIQAIAFEDDDRECKRHSNEGKCITFPGGHYTCPCLFHEKPKLAISEWDSEKEVRFFTQTCEVSKLAHHEDTCVVLPGNPYNDDEYEFLCPNNGYFQTWGAFGPRKDSYHVRLWYRCCEVQCPKWNCQWTPFTDPQKKFVLPLDDAYVQGVRGKYFHEKMDTSWSLRVCACDHSSNASKTEL